MGKSKFLGKFGSHFAIERFGIMFVSLALCMCLLVSSIVAKKVKSDHRTLTGQAQYTSTTATSLTASVATVRGVYTNKDHTKCFVLWRFDDMSNMPLSASDYHFFLRGYDSFYGFVDSESKPTSTFYVFGATGYMGMYLYEAGGFPSQVLSLTLRSLRNISGISNADAVNLSDITYGRYDQCDIYFNPGGSFAPYAAFLERESWTPFDVYGEIVISAQETSAKSVLKQDLIDMHRCKIRMDEYASRLEQQDVVVSDAPLEIKDDVIYAYRTSELTSGSNPEELHWTIRESAWTNDDQSRYVTNSKATLFLDTKYVVPGGFDYEWQTGSVRAGYLAGITGSSDLRTWAEYVAGIRAQSNDNSFGNTVSATRWYFSSGAEIDLAALTSDSAIDADRMVASTITSLEDCWKEYYKIKCKYQCDDLPRLLDLERDVQSVENSYSVSIDDNGSLLTQF